ncbi:hypothetical protein Tsubulata_034840 [Turnera subulata]|uniref:Uncharacterized protein n=1 Tax=Turnera subulata TaxID=218843 RepID=A0A9Q0GC23_9ROSI|nr:hypothetical protein Tsubulata_034840 [Turnera subulata]
MSDRAPKERDTTFPATKHISSRRTHSFSSSSSLSSCSSCFPDDSPLSPATPLRYSGVPFSWEQLPGIPKSKPIIHHKKKDSTTLKVLPLPPPVMNRPSSKRFNSDDIATPKKMSSHESFRRDPFFAALVECSKDAGDDTHDHDQHSNSNNYWSGPKVTRSISDRFGFVNLYTSCKRTCSVSESIVYLPRPSRTSYDLINRQSRRTYRP